VRRYFSRKTIVLLSLLAIGATAGGVAYAECEGSGGGGTYVPPAPTLSATEVMAGDAFAVFGSGLTSLTSYAVMVSQWAYDSSTGSWVDLGSAQELAPHDWAAIPDSSGNLEPIDVSVPTGFVVGYTYYIYLQSADGEVSDSAPVKVTKSSPPPGNPCPPDLRDDGSTGPDGGLYGRMNSKGCEKHHMPSKDSFKGHSDYSKYCAPAIRMLRADHVKTASHGNLGDAAKQFRAKESELIAAGKVREAFELNVKNEWKTGIQDLFGSRYDDAIDKARRAIDEIPECRSSGA